MSAPQNIGIRDTSAFARMLRERRLAAGLTQAALAERAGLSTRAVQHLEAGLGQPYADSARRLAAALALGEEARIAFEIAGRPAPRRTPRLVGRVEVLVCQLP